MSFTILTIYSIIDNVKERVFIIYSENIGGKND